MITFFKTIIYTPLYNVLILLTKVPFVDAGVAAIILTLLVKLVLYPLSKKAFIAQHNMKGVNAELNKIKEKYPNKEEQAVKVMEFYRERKLNPFSGILSMFIQMPIVISLYYIFLKSGLPNIDPILLYGFIVPPDSISMNFLGFLDISGKSPILAVLAAVSSFIQMHLATSGDKSVDTDAKDFSQIMAKQMKYTFPIIVFLISWKISGVVALYWFASNVFTIIQDKFLKKSLANSEKPKEAVDLVAEN